MENPIGPIVLCVALASTCAKAGEITSVLSATGQLPIIAPNTWIVIKGNGLVPQTRPGGVVWNSAPEFAQGKLPTQLGAVRVSINRNPGFISFFCSGGSSKSCPQDQINVLTPVDNATGPVDVTVVSDTGVFAFVVTMQALIPGFFQVGGSSYVFAMHQDGTLVGPPNPGISSLAIPNEEIIVYGNGFGDVTPPFTNGSSTQHGVLPQVPQIQIGGIPVVPEFAGLVSPGLFQFNVRVPTSAPSGYLAISAIYKGTTTQNGPVLPVQP